MVPRDLDRPRALARGGRRDREVRERPRRHRDRQRRRRHRGHRGLRPGRRHRDHDPAGRGRAAPVALRLHRRRLPLRAVRRQSRDGQPGRAALARPEDRVGRRPPRVAHGARRGPQGRLLHVTRPEGLDLPLGLRARRPRHPRVPRPVPDVARRRSGEDHLGARGRRERRRARHDHRHRILDRRVGRASPSPPPTRNRPGSTAAPTSTRPSRGTTPACPSPSDSPRGTRSAGSTTGRTQATCPPTTGTAAPTRSYASSRFARSTAGRRSSRPRSARSTRSRARPR